MISFTILSGIILYGLTFLCFFIPLKCGERYTAKLVVVVLGAIITLSIIGNFSFLVFFIWPVIVIFQIIFITYWTFRYFGRKKTGKITAIILTILFLLVLMQPWLSDLAFSKKDVRNILSFHGIILNDDFSIIENESGGLMDYRETFTIKISANDFNLLSQKIRSSKNYKGFFTDYTNMPRPDYNTKDTVDLETDKILEREYYSADKMENGTDHFIFQLFKKDKQLSYIGSDE